MNNIINKIIQESVRNVLSEMDLVPTNVQGDTNLVHKQTVNAWRMIYRLMDNVKTKMDYDWQGKNGNITNKDIDGVIDYIYNALNSVTRNTINR